MRSSPSLAGAHGLAEINTRFMSYEALQSAPPVLGLLGFSDRHLLDPFPQLTGGSTVGCVFVHNSKLG